MSHARSVPHADRLLSKSAEHPQDKALSQDAVFETLYAAAFPRVYAFVRYQVSTTETAQEIVSRVFLKAYRHRHKIPAGDSGTHWVFRIAHTTLIDYWRVEGRRERANVPVQELSELPSTSTTPEADYQRRQEVSALLQVMSDLPDDDRAMLALKFAADRTNRDIASILDLTEAAVSMRLLRALRRLRQRLQSIGWNERN